MRRDAERFSPTFRNDNAAGRVARPPARLAELEETIERGLQTFVEVGRALLEIRGRRLYRERGFHRFEEYVKHRWGWSRSYAYRQIDAAKVADNLSPIGDIPANEAQARELADLEPDQQREVAQAIHESGQTFETVTAKDVREIAQEVKSGTPPAMAVHFSSESEEWYTPPEIVARVIETLGAIDLDPCSDAGGNIPASLRFTKEQDSLSRSWAGRVYMNPPYGNVIPEWTEKLIGEYRAGRVLEAIALVPARTDTAWFRPLWKHGALCFIDGRLKFSGYKSAAPFPSVAVYFGDNVDGFKTAFSPVGVVSAALVGGIAA